MPHHHLCHYQHILAALDLSPSASPVLQKALQLSQDHQARLSLLHVVEYLPPVDSIYEPVMSNHWVVDEQALLEQAKHSLSQFYQKLLKDLERSKQQTTSHSAIVEATQAVQLGAPRYEINQYIEAHQCDLLVLGSHGRHGIQRLLGSTANSLLHDMPCDILAVKIKEP